MAQNFGKNVELNKQLAQLTGYTGDFGNGLFGAFLDQNPQLRSVVDAVLPKAPAPSPVPTQFGIGSTSLSPTEAADYYYNQMGGSRNANNYLQSVMPRYQNDIRQIVDFFSNYPAPSFGLNSTGGSDPGRPDTGSAIADTFGDFGRAAIAGLGLMGPIGMFGGLTGFNPLGGVADVGRDSGRSGVSSGFGGGMTTGAHGGRHGIGGSGGGMGGHGVGGSRGDAY